MTAARVPETDRTTEGRDHVEAYDRMQAALRAKGWLETPALLAAGIAAGRALEVGSGPGYLGLEWLLRTHATELVGLDTSPDMLAVAERHAAELALAGRARYVLGSATAVPFEDGAFDAVFSSRSLHEWNEPATAFGELWRVLGPGGRLWVSDLRRDVSRKARGFLEQRMTSAVVLDGLHASLAAAYTAAEVRALLAAAGLAGCSVVETPIGLCVTGDKSR
ncbi:MAG: class I SAM-dependent methyltransferase [Myxococcales bacterium]|nr:class I SAM-dependent methyltransferase [Myxococcales bacterium]